MLGHGTNGIALLPLIAVTGVRWWALRASVLFLRRTNGLYSKNSPPSTPNSKG